MTLTYSLTSFETNNDPPKGKTGEYIIDSFITNFPDMAKMAKKMVNKPFRIRVTPKRKMTQNKWKFQNPELSKYDLPMPESIYSNKGWIVGETVTRKEADPEDASNIWNVTEILKEINNEYAVFESIRNLKIGHDQPFGIADAGSKVIMKMEITIKTQVKINKANGFFEDVKMEYEYLTDITTEKEDKTEKAIMYLTNVSVTKRLDS